MNSSKDLKIVQKSKTILNATKNSKIVQKAKAVLDSPKNLKLVQNAQTALAVLAVIVFIVGCVLSQQAGQERQYKKNAQSVANDIEVAITNKTNGDSSNSDVEFTFNFIIKNNSDIDVNCVAGVLKVMNANGDLLLSGDTYFGTYNTNTTSLGYEIPKNSERAFSLTWETGINDSTIELWQTDFVSLNISFELTNIRLENGDLVEVSRDAFVKQHDTNFEKTYQDALSLFNQGKYAEATPLFKELGLYKESSNYYYQSIYNNAVSLYSQEKYGEAYQALDSINGYYAGVGDKMSDIVSTVLEKAESFASVGNYVSAYTILEQIGYDDTYYLYQAYQYASQGYFADAVDLGLTVVFIPEGIETIPDNYFKPDYSSNNQLKKVILPSTIKNIGMSAFSGCTKLAEINLPNGLKTIGNYAFYKCTSLKAINMPDSVEHVGNNAFEECTKLETVTTSSGLTKILSYTFKNCTSLTTLTIKNGVEVIESSAFSYCTSLMNVTLPGSLVEIQGSAFQQCSSLIEITIPTNVHTIGNRVFIDCSALQRVYFINQIGWNNYGTPLDVSDAQNNAMALKNVSPGPWQRN